MEAFAIQTSITLFSLCPTTMSSSVSQTHCMQQFLSFLRHCHSVLRENIVLALTEHATNPSAALRQSCCPPTGRISQAYAFSNRTFSFFNCL